MNEPYQSTADALRLVATCQSPGFVARADTSKREQQISFDGDCVRCECWDKESRRWIPDNSILIRFDWVDIRLPEGM